MIIVGDDDDDDFVENNNLDDDGTDDVKGNAVSVVSVREGTQTLEGWTHSQVCAILLTSSMQWGITWNDLSAWHYLTMCIFWKEKLELCYYLKWIFAPDYVPQE